MNSKEKNLDDFPDYIISSDGYIMKNNREIVKPTIYRHEYNKVRVYLYGKSIDLFLAPRVLSSFQPVPDDSFIYFCEHINGNKTDDRLSNLRWVRRPEF